MEFSKRMDAFAPGIFTRLSRRKAELIAQGIKVCDLSVGTPDLPPEKHIKDALIEAAADPKQYIYALDDISELTCAVAAWYARRFGVTVDPDNEVTSLLGSQEGLAHIALTLCDPGDTVLVPDPGYPIFSGGPRLADARVVPVPQRKENGFVIDFADIPSEDARKAKLMIVSYPNNPTGALAPDAWYDDLIVFAKQYDIAVLHDNAYCELVFADKPGGSFLAHRGAKDVGVEFNSLSKSYSVPGMRLGFCIGNPDIVGAMKRLKSNIDYGVFLPIQLAGVAALNGPQDTCRIARDTYRRRRDILIEGLKEAGWAIEAPKGSMFVWAPVPEKYQSAAAFVEALMERAHTIVVPGDSFGAQGAGYVRIALVQDEREISAAVARIRESGLLV